MARDSTGQYFWSTLNITVSTAGAVTVTPSSATLTIGQSTQFTANVSVTWAVDGVTGGNSTVGTITAAGLYTAPGSAGTHSITGASNSAPAQRGTASVRVQATDTVAPALQSGSVSPASLDTSGGAGEVTLTINVTDDLSGFNSGFFTLTNSANSQPNNFQAAHCVVNRLSSGTATNGIFTGLCNFNRYSQPGSFVFTNAYLYDNARHQRIISGQALGSLLSAKVQVTSVPRPTPLTLSSPADGSSALSPVHVLASISSRQPVTSTQVFIDGASAYSSSRSAINAYLKLSSGIHRVQVQSRERWAWFQQHPRRSTYWPAVLL